jgi:hypothetical protein
MNVTLLISVASSERPIAQAGTLRFATKYRSVDVCRLEKRTPNPARTAM